MSSARCTILVVDDDVGVAESLTDVLEDEGYAVATRFNGFEALDYLRSQPRPCLILLDWMMPGCDGATFRARQKADPLMADVPVVLLTADLRLEQKKATLDAVGYLAKPVNLDKLLSLIEHYCEK